MEAASYALSKHFIISELQEAVSRKISHSLGVEAAAVVHCVAAAITITVAATITGTSRSLIERLPDTTGMKSRVVLPVTHSVNYGHPIEQAVRLAGAQPILVGNKTGCTIDEIAQACARSTTCCLLLVSSRLVSGTPVDFHEAVLAAHDHSVPVIIDGAAQDFRISELLGTGADAVLLSGQKYLASPTAGLVIGRKEIIDSVREQEKGIGRGMKASKEAIVGVLAAIELRQRLDIENWKKKQSDVVESFVKKANRFASVNARAVADTTGLPFDRVHVVIDNGTSPISASQLSIALKDGKPSIWVMDHLSEKSELIFELVQLTDREIDDIFLRLSELLEMA